MPAYLNRGATYTEEPQLPDDPLIDLLAMTYPIDLHRRRQRKRPYMVLSEVYNLNI